MLTTFYSYNIADEIFEVQQPLWIEKSSPTGNSTLIKEHSKITIQKKGVRGKMRPESSSLIFPLSKGALCYYIYKFVIRPQEQRKRRKMESFKPHLVKAFSLVQLLGK